MKSTKTKKGQMRFVASQHTVSPKISLFYKLQIMKASILLVAAFVIILSPNTAHAGFFSSIGNSIGNFFGAGDAQAINVTPLTDNVIHNSQNVPLLEPSLTPDLKNTANSVNVTIVGDQALESKNGPMGTEADLDTNSGYVSTAKFGTYVVEKSGQSIADIAKATGVSTYALLYANSDIKRSDMTKVGTVLTVIPLNGTAYKVKKGETSAKLAEKYGVSVRDMLEYNLLEKASEIQSGDTIFLVGVSASDIKSADTKEKQAKIAKQSKSKPVDAVDTPLVAEAPTASVVPETPKPAQQAPIVSEGQPSGKIRDGYIWPFPASIGRISQELHADDAYDFAAPIGTPIYAIHEGTVLVAKDSGYNGGFGKNVIIDFTDGRQAILAHMSKVVVQSGETVQQGQIIGYVGNTGKSTGPHTHIGFHGDLDNPYAGLSVNTTSDNFHD